MMRPIMIMAGGTGGHVFPALAVADYLKTQGVPLLWLGTERGLEARVVPDAGYRLLTLSISGIRGKGYLTLVLAPFKVVFAIGQAIKLMIRHRPAAVLGMGGFASGPGGIAAWLMQIPLVIHEQNAIAGMTNRWLSKIATRVFEAFPDTFPAQRSATHVGNPVRESIINIEPHHSQDAQLKILIVGGSLGAMTLNRVVPAALARLSVRPQIWHQTGQRECEKTRHKYKELGLEARVEPFLDQIDQAYAWADIVICRSGALTVSELAAAGLPAILIPYPHAVDDHQTANARYLVDAGAAVMISDDNFCEENLLPIIGSWLQHPDRIQTMSVYAKSKAMMNATKEVAVSLQEVAYG